MQIYPPTHPVQGNRGDQWTVDGQSPHGSFQPPLQDAALRPASGVWTPVVNAALSASGLVTTSSLGWEMAVPFYVPIATPLKALAVDVTVIGAAGSILRLGVRANAAGLPGTLLQDFGGASGVATGVQACSALSTPLSLHTGWYFYTVTPQGFSGTGPTIRTMINGDPRFPIFATTPTTGQVMFGYVQTGINGALPASFAAGSTTVTAPIRCFAQAA